LTSGLRVHTGSELGITGINLKQEQKAQMFGHLSITGSRGSHTIERLTTPHGNLLFPTPKTAQDSFIVRLTNSTGQSRGIMPSIFQTRFQRFHEAIKLGNTDENATLREKREAVLKRMRDKGLTFTWLNQGSYAMGTGVVPVEADFDIDVGVIFTGNARPADPLAVKQLVFDSVLGHTPNVEWRRHCIRVQYVKAGEATYHVDLPVYWKDCWSGALTLAVGKQHSGVGHKEWQEADPQGLVDRVTSHLVGEDRWQFRRVIRYLKRWKDIQFPAMGNAAPVGIGITIAALSRFSPAKDLFATTSAGYDDLEALINLVNRMHGSFSTIWHDGENATRLVQQLPVKPYKDVFDRMSNQQMKEFKERLATLASHLDAAKRTGRVDELVRAFGTDFPVT
jgi:hypothetical protein